MVQLVQPVGVQPGRHSAAIAVKALAAGVCVAAALVLMTSQTVRDPVSQPSFLFFRGAERLISVSVFEQSTPMALDSANVFEKGYKKPVEGHWIPGGPGGGMQWIDGKTYVATYGAATSAFQYCNPVHVHAT